MKLELIAILGNNHTQKLNTFLAYEENRLCQSRVRFRFSSWQQRQVCQHKSPKSP